MKSAGMAYWNQKNGFRSEWLWQYGNGPFEIVKEEIVPSEPGYLGFGQNKIEIYYQPGFWIWIKLTGESDFHRVYPWVAKAWFHSDWFIIK